MERSKKWVGASVVVATAIALVWLNAPVVPALAGAIGAGLVLYWRARPATR